MDIVRPYGPYPPTSMSTQEAASVHHRLGLCGTFPCGRLDSQTRGTSTKENRRTLN
jgi:hypothetical protein